MERYRVLKKIGDGTFGTVHKAVNRSTGEVVAIKLMKKKYHSWEECLTLREIKSLRKLSHNNIVKLKEAFRFNDQLHLVFEFLDQNLLQLLKDTAVPITEEKLRGILYQIFAGLAYMHKHGFFHRDLKPENILIQKDMCKIADFGLAREIRSKPPFTEYVSTRWYRAPEIVLRATNYNSPVDIFAMGCIMTEMLTTKPLAPGANENDQIIKFCQVLGTPSPSEWPEGFKLASQAGLKLPDYPRQHISIHAPNTSPEFQDLAEQCLKWNPAKRPTAAQILQLPFFSNNVPVIANTTGGLLKSRQSRERSREDSSQQLRLIGSGTFDRGSSHIGDKSAKGRLYMKPSNVIQPVGFNRAAPGVPGGLPEVPELRGREHRLPALREPAQIGPIKGPTPEAPRNPYLQQGPGPIQPGAMPRKQDFGSGSSLFKAPGRIASSSMQPQPTFIQRPNPGRDASVGGLSNLSNAHMLSNQRIRAPQPAGPGAGLKFPRRF